MEHYVNAFLWKKKRIGLEAVPSLWMKTRENIILAYMLKKCLMRNVYKNCNSNVPQKRDWVNFLPSQWNRDKTDRAIMVAKRRATFLNPLSGEISSSDNVAP
ncbi:hypothetical protein CEXT_483621 [Caerostris extrusa]|uniref:Uncharacterized protein n=1 Tax=Caerostris extrusa TaxID=172846 RepID=A0AAV4QEW7_CAEEX|nr:hypothetical protein CEXT_483621 [Caerostris extrusa]